MSTRFLTVSIHSVDDMGLELSLRRFFFQRSLWRENHNFTITDHDYSRRCDRAQSRWGFLPYPYQWLKPLASKLPAFCLSQKKATYKHIRGGCPGEVNRPNYPVKRKWFIHWLVNSFTGVNRKTHRRRRFFMQMKWISEQNSTTV